MIKRKEGAAYKTPPACKYCSEPLYFEKNENDKFVPMKVYSREPHDCPERPEE
jgi:hypothetical protein